MIYVTHSDPYCYTFPIRNKYDWLDGVWATKIKVQHTSLPIHLKGKAFFDKKSICGLFVINRKHFFLDSVGEWTISHCTSNFLWFH